MYYKLFYALILFFKIFFCLILFKIFGEIVGFVVVNFI